MPLVDYSSDCDSDPVVQEKPGKAEDAATDSNTDNQQPPTKKRRTCTDAASQQPPAEALPPLPAAFHDQYAATVRVSNVDDPSLHQGRRRVIPHVSGNWPTHLYIEWHPTPEDHSVLAALVAALQEALCSDENEDGDDDRHTDAKVFTFLTSDLGAPQPLHVSLSRPLALSTADKDDFLERVAQSIAGSGIRPFELRPTELVWHRSPDSDRTFLVLRVVTATKTTPTQTATTAKTAHACNPQLAVLLGRCNALARKHGQPTLYETGRLPAAADPPPSRGTAAVGTGSPRSPGESPVVAAVDATAFHVSIAWTFAAPDVELVRRTSEVFRDRTSRGDDEAVGDQTDRTESRSFEHAVAVMRIRVDGLKVKIGNVVSHVALPGRRGGVGGSLAGGSILGIG